MKRINLIIQECPISQRKELILDIDLFPIRIPIINELCSNNILETDLVTLLQSIDNGIKTYAKVYPIVIQQALNGIIEQLQGIQKQVN